MPPSTTNSLLLHNQAHKFIVRTCLNLLVLLAIICNVASEAQVSPITAILLVAMVLRLLLPNLGNGSSLWNFTIFLVVLQIFYEYTLNIPVRVILTHAALSLAVYRCVTILNGRRIGEIAFLAMIGLANSGEHQNTMSTYGVVVGLILFSIILYSCYMLRSRGESFSDFPTQCRLRLSSPTITFLTLHTLLVFALIIVAISIMPKIDIENLLIGKSKTGFSEDIVLGKTSSISADYSIAFRVDFPQPTTFPQVPYWRVQVTELYLRGRFTSLTSQQAPLVTAIHTNAFDLDSTYNISGMNLYVEPGMGTWLPMPYSAKVLRFPGTNSFRANTQTRTLRQLSDATQVTPYQIIGTNLRGIVVSAQPVSHFSTMLTRDKDADAYFTQTAKKLRSDDIAQTVENSIRYLEQNHAYGTSSLPINLKTDPVGSWASSKSPGHCEYFAAALTFLLRANNIPAHVVGGFRGGVWNPHGDYLIVRNSDAHAWVEYHNGTAWVTADPTPGNRHYDALDTQSTHPALMAYKGWNAWVDCMRMWWYRHAITFDPAHANTWWQQLFSVIGVIFDTGRMWLQQGLDSVVLFITTYRTLLLYIQVSSLILIILLYPRLTARYYPQRYIQLQRNLAKKFMTTASLKQKHYQILHRIRYDHPKNWDLPSYFWWSALKIYLCKN